MWLYSIKSILGSNDLEDNSSILPASLKECFKRPNFGPAAIFLKNIAFYSDNFVASGDLELLICPTPVLLPKPHINLFSFVQRNCLSQLCPCKCELQLWLILAPDSVYLLWACVLDPELLTNYEDWDICSTNHPSSDNNSPRHSPVRICAGLKHCLVTQSVLNTNELVYCPVSCYASEM